MDSVVICRNSEEEKNSISVKNMDLRDASASRNTKAGRGNRGNFANSYTPAKHFVQC